MATVYEEIDDLKRRVSALESETSDSGWNVLPLAEGITGYSTEQQPMYRKIGKTLYLSGVVRGISQSNMVIATLPENFRPSKKVILPFASIGQKINRMEIFTNGNIQYSRSTIEPTIEENWHSIACCFSL